MQVTRKIAAAAAVATVATLGLATVVSANVIDDATSKAGLPDVSSLTDGYSAAFLGAAVVAAAGAVIAAVTLRLPKAQPETAEADTEAVAA